MIYICRYPGFVLSGTRVLALLPVHVLRRAASSEDGRYGSEEVLLRKIDQLGGNPS